VSPTVLRWPCFRLPCPAWSLCLSGVPSGKSHGFASCNFNRSRTVLITHLAGWLSVFCYDCTALVVRLLFTGKHGRDGTRTRKIQLMGWQATNYFTLLCCHLTPSQYLPELCAPTVTGCEGMGHLLFSWKCFLTTLSTRIMLSSVQNVVNKVNTFCGYFVTESF
jgi:hypothetical protein